MDALAIPCILIGVLVILARGPLIFAPAATLRVYRKLIASDARLRVVGFVLAALGAAVVRSGWGVEGLAAQALSVLGWLLCFAGLAVLLFPGPWRRVADSVLGIASESVDAAFLRVVGVIAVAAGAGLVYLGLRLL
ncbi:MAG: DUF2065 family protein [Myxococcota bacterium]